MLPARLNRNSGRAQASRTVTGHGKYVRGFRCMVENPDCAGKMQACHVDFADGKGMGLKVHDAFMVPMCAHHHLGEQHVVGWPEFRRRHGLTEDYILGIAREIARRSPAIIRAAIAAGHDTGHATDNEVQS